MLDQVEICDYLIYNEPSLADSHAAVAIQFLFINYQ